jgi:hypothetical protein
MGAFPFIKRDPVAVLAFITADELGDLRGRFDF